MGPSQLQEKSAVTGPIRLGRVTRAAWSHQPTLDGAWWPRSLDLGEELPGLIVELANLGTRVSRVLYNPQTWQGSPPRKLGADGRTIKLGWFRSMDPHVLTLTTAGGLERYDLLVIPPDATPGAAGKAMDAATTSDNRLSASTVLQQAT